MGLAAVEPAPLMVTEAPPAEDPVFEAELPLPAWGGALGVWGVHEARPTIRAIAEVEQSVQRVLLTEKAIKLKVQGNV
jgi:hypothetical protein